ncbi:1-deoxy-D-xylulose-5-phosphate synthase [bioreactor metagenome]|uniref:1-deoxy-D-xylulose-5-phosphate synthase n=1 Tax=bioreactor metagenome TaxID=1076179 RepID=A0A645HAQ9_9ZZZZ
MVDTCMESSKLLEERGIKAGVVNARFIKPIDETMLRQIAREVGIIVTVEDNVLAGGFGSAVIETLSACNLNWVKTLRLGLPDKFVEHGTRAELLEIYGLTADKIADRVGTFILQFGAR